MNRKLLRKIIKYMIISNLFEGLFLLITKNYPIQKKEEEETQKISRSPRK